MEHLSRFRGRPICDRFVRPLPVDWLPEDATREQMLAVLRPLLELPVELVLPTHGAPTDRAALEHALS